MTTQATRCSLSRTPLLGGRQGHLRWLEELSRVALAQTGRYCFLLGNRCLEGKQCWNLRMRLLRSEIFSRPGR